jgi:outer membrane biosynthesis protein TonB
MERVILRTGPLTEPLAELQDCAVKVSNQIAENSRIAIEAGTPSEPTEIERWTGILQQNYPMDMLREEEEGRIGVVLTIGTNGKPSYCEVSDVAGPTSFNDTVCLLLLRHATFEPARNGEGEPIVSRYATRVTFRLNS